MHPEKKSVTNQKWHILSRKGALASAALEVDGMEAESTALRSSTDKLVDASVLFDSLMPAGSMNCFLVGCLVPPPDAKICPLIFLQSAPDILSCSKKVKECQIVENINIEKKKGKHKEINRFKGQIGFKKSLNKNVGMEGLDQL